MNDDQLNLFEPSRVPGVERVVAHQTTTQPEQPKKSLQEQATEWMHTPGGRHIMRDLYAITAGYVKAWRRTGIPICMSLVWEIERQRIKEVTARALRICKARGIKWEKPDGYTQPNAYRAYVARHIMDRRPEWSGIFETHTVQGDEE